MKNTDKSYIIEVVNYQTTDGETSVITEKAEGKFHTNADKTYVTYHTCEDGEKYSTVIVIGAGEVSVKRSGFYSAYIICSKERMTKSRHITPYGRFTADIKTQSIIQNFKDNGGKLELKYTSLMQGQEIYNNMTIKIEEKI